MDISIRIKFESDWHVGSGTEIPGIADQAVVRDHDGLPYVPAKTLTGILRDGCEFVANLLGNGWHDVVDAIFGTQSTTHNSGIRPARLSIRPAYLEGKDEILADRDLGLKDFLTFIKPQVKIDPKTGRTEEHKLFFTEVVRAGTCLIAQAHVSDDLTISEKALLIAGARAVRRIGGKRRRGLGKCRLTVDMEPFEWQSVLSQPPQLPDFSRAYQLERVASSTNNPDNQWVTIGYTMKLVTPVCIPNGVYGNQVRTLDYIPGTHLMSLIHQTLAAQGQDLFAAVKQGRVVVTNAYPMIGEKQTGPVPMALFKAKTGKGLQGGKDDRVYNFMVEKPDSDVQPKQYRNGYVEQEPDRGFRPRYTTVDLGISMHNVIEDKSQRPTEAVGGVYSYETMPAGLVLSGEIRVQGLVDAEGFLEELREKSRHYSIGRAKKDDFGQVEMGFKIVAREKKPMDLSGDNLFVWILSDTLIRDPKTMMWDTSPRGIVRWIARYAGLDETLFETEKYFVRDRRHEGWIRSWGLPRPSLVGLQGGSCMKIKIRANPDDKDRLTGKLAELQVTGIGERTAEGFGQIVFQHPVLTTRMRELKIPEKLDMGKANKLTQEKSRTPDYLRKLKKMAARKRIDDAVDEYLVHTPDPLGLLTGPSNSQLGGLKALLLTVAHTQDLTMARTWLEKQLGRENKGANRWGQRPIKNVIALLREPELIWKDVLKITSKSVREGNHEYAVHAFLTRAIGDVLDARERGNHKESNHGA